MSLSPHLKDRLDQALESSGLRSTRQREQIFDVLMARRDHPTADEIYARAKQAMPTISLATVYNCLETLVECGLVRQVNFDREPTRFCPNLSEHAHFHCKATGQVYDIDLPAEVLMGLKDLLPEGFQAETLEVNFRGRGNGAN
ncbi:MAG: Fur family transcriptional regulator [Opitutales bacterium]